MNKEAWTQLKNNIPNIVLFVFVCVIVCPGIYGLLFFVSESGIDAEGNDTNPRLWASLCIGFLLTALGFYLYFDEKKKLTILMDSLMILRHHYGKDLWLKSTPPLDEFDPDKDLVLGLILQLRGIAKRFNSNIHELDKILEKLDSDEPWHEKLENLDGLILDNIEDWVKRHFPKEVYFLRLRLLDDFIHASDQGKFLVYDRPQGLSSEKVSIAKSEEQLLDSGGDITREFYKLILNKYYDSYQGFQAQPVNFDHRLFRKCFSMEYAEWAYLREAYSLLYDAYEFNAHRKSPPTIGELLSNVGQMYENKEVPKTDATFILLDAFGSLYKAHKIYEEHLRDMPIDEIHWRDKDNEEFFRDLFIDESCNRAHKIYLAERIKIDFENYADKELPSGAGEKMLPYLDKAEKYLIESETFLKISEEEMPKFWDSPAPIRQEEKEPAIDGATTERSEESSKDDERTIAKQIKETIMFFKRSDKKTILVISDEPNILQTLKDRLEMNDYKAITLEPKGIGKDCHNLVKYLEQVDIVILAHYSVGPYLADEIIQQIYHNYPEMPIIFTPCNARDGTHIINKFPTMDIRYFKKPFDLSELLGVIAITLKKEPAIDEATTKRSEESLKDDERTIAKQIAERHNKYGATLTNPKTGKDLLAGMTDEQREKYRQFMVRSHHARQEGGQSTS